MLDRENLRKLCHGLLLADTAVIDDFRRTTEMDEFTVTVRGLWRLNRVLVRIYHRPIQMRDVQEVEDFASITGALESLLLAAQGLEDSDLTPRPGVTIVSDHELSQRITSSALARWDEDRPSLATDRLDLMLRLSHKSLIDPVGIEWLPSLALNELPPSLEGYEVEPQDLFERKSFRLLTATFRFGGTRYGESRRGQRLPDAVLDWPDGSTTSALFDCKAASSGYRMTSDEFLRFRNYWETLAPQLSGNGQELKYLIVLSSYFPGQEGQSHPYRYRADQVFEETGLKLVYMTASDLAWAAARLEGDDTSLHRRCEFNWEELFENGLVHADHFDSAIEGVL